MHQPSTWPHQLVLLSLLKKHGRLGTLDCKDCKDKASSLEV